MAQTVPFGWEAGAHWRDDAITRLQDFIARKSVRAAHHWGALRRRLEASTSVDQLKAVVRDVVATLRRDRTAGVGVDAEFEELCERILAYGERRSIENYSAFLFTVDVEL